VAGRSQLVERLDPSRQRLALEAGMALVEQYWVPPESSRTVEECRAERVAAAAKARILPQHGEVDRHARTV
jgi:hypothetical protein